MFLHSASSSAKMWLEIRMLTPSAASSFKVWATSWRPIGSRPFIGSSSTSNSGSCKRPWPSLTRCFMPLEYWLIRLFQCSRGNFTRSRTASARDAASPPGIPASSARLRNQSIGRNSLGTASPSGQNPSRRSSGGLFHGLSPKTVSWPELG